VSDLDALKAVQTEYLTMEKYLGMNFDLILLKYFYSRPTMRNNSTREKLSMNGSMIFQNGDLSIKLG